MSRDPALDYLLALHNEVMVMENGYWTKFEIWEVAPSKHIPHGIRYNLTLHDHYNKRIFGYDNAHAPSGKANRRGRYKGRIIEYDHVHLNQTDTGTPYRFTSAQQLMNDFFEAVDRIVEGK